MKTKLHYILAALMLPFVASASISISGTALKNVDSLSDGDFGVLLVDTSGSGFSSFATTGGLAAGVDLTAGSSFGSGYYVADTATASFFFGSTTLGFNTGTFDIEGPSAVASSGDSFAIFTFDGSSSTSVADSTYEIWTQSVWQLPTDGSGVTFPADLPAYNSGSAGASGTVAAVPEPSTFATLAGLCALGFVMLRRRG